MTTREFMPLLNGQQWQVVEVEDGQDIGQVVADAADRGCAFEIARLMDMAYRAGRGDYVARTLARSMN